MNAPASAYEFPRTYRLSGGWRWFFIVLGVVIALPSAIGVAYFLHSYVSDGPQDSLFFAGLSLVLGLMGVLLSIYGARVRVVLEADAITYIGLVTKKRLGRQDVL